MLQLLLSVLSEASKQGAAAESLIITDTKLSVVAHTCDLNTWEVKYHKLKSSLDYTVRPRPAWAV